MERSKLHQKQQVLLQQRRRRLAAASQSRHVSADPSAAESSRSRGTTSKGSNARQQQLSSSRPTTRSTPPRHDNRIDQEVSIFDSTSNVDIFSSGSSVDEINNIGRQKKDERRGKNKNGNFDSKLRDQYSHSQPHWKHKERLRQLGQQSRRSALVASAMGGMVMQGVSISGDNDKGSRKSQTPSQPQFSAAIVTPEKRTEAMSGRDKSNSMKAEVVPPDQCQDDGVEVDEFWNFFDSQQSDFLRSLEPWPQQGQGQLNRGVQIITPPRHKSQSSNFPNEPVQSSRSHSQNGIPSSIDNGTNNSSSRSSQQQFSPAVAVTPEKGDKPLLRPFSTSAFDYDNNSKTTDQKSSDINGFEGGEEGVEIDLDEFWNHFDSQHSHSVRSPKRLPQLPHEQLTLQSPPLPTQQNPDSNYSPKSSERLSQNKPQSTVSSSASSPPSPSSHQQSFQSWPQHLWPELPSDPPPVASASTHQADNTKNLSDSCDARNTQSNGPQPKQQSLPTSIPQTTAPKKLNPKLLSQFEKYSAESLQQQAQQPQKRQQNQCHHQLHHQQEQPQQQHDPRHAGQPQNEHSLNLPNKIQQSQNSQAHSTSAANTSTSSEDYQFNFDFSDESFGNGSDEKGCQRSDDHDNCFGEIGDFDNGFAVSKSSYAGFDDNRTARKENINELFATGNDQFRTETSISLCWDDISTPIVGTSKDPFSSIISHSDKPSSPSTFFEVWNKGEEFCHEDSSSNNNNFGDKSISGGVHDDFMNWRRINLEDVSGKVDCEEDDNDWIHWEDPFELMESMKSSNCSEDMKPSHQNKFNASPDRTTVMTSDVSNDSSVKVALSLSNDDTFNRTTATASTDKSVSNQNKIVRRIAVDPPSSTFPRTSVKATAARFNKVAGKTSHNAPNSQETPRTLPPQPSESIPSPRTPQTSNTTAKSSSSTANSMGMAIHKLEMAEYSPPLDEVYSSASIASSSAKKPQHDQPLLNSSEGLQKFGPHPLSTPSSNPLISSPIISIHGDSSIFPDDDSIFSNFSHLRQMRMQTNAIKNSGVSPARNSNKQGSNIVNNSNNTNLSSSANVASVGSCNDVLNFSERKNHSTQTIQIEETSLTVTHTPSLKANRSCNEMSSSEANIIPSSTKRPPPQTLQGSPSNFRPGFSQARPSSDYEKADEKIQVNPRTLLWEGQLLQGIRSDYSNSTRSFEIPEENANIMAYLVENAVQEATWSKKPQSPVSDSKKIFGKNPSKRHWPPPHPTTPLEPKAALISRHYNSLANAISPSGHHATQSPTRSDHSADAAAGVKHGMQMRSGMFEPSELNAESDTTGLDTRGCGNHSKLLQTIETKVDDERSKDDSLASKLVKLSQSTGKRSGGGASHHDDAKSVSSSKVSGGISLQPSLESECLRQNAAIAMEMDEMMAFFHENHQDVGSQPGKNETSRMTDPMNYEFLTFSQFDLSPEDSVEVAKDPPDELITTETTLMSSKKDSKITSAPPIKTSSIPNTNRESRVEQVFTSKSSYYSNQHLPRSNHLSSKFSSDKRHFISLLSVDEESEFEEPRWDPTNDTSSSKKSPDVKVSEKNELTQFMDTIMRGCYLHGGENSDVLSYRDEIGDANIILPEVDDANNARDDTSFLHDQNKPSKKCPQINLADSFERISKERARIRREDTTPLRTNKSKAKEAIAFYEGKPLNTAIPPLRADLPKPAQSPESESNNHKTYAECTSGKRILDSDRQFSLAQSKMATTTQCHDERSRKRDSIFDEDVLKSYRATQTSDVIESYRIQDRKMPAVSKSLDEDRVDDNSQTAAKKLLQLDGKENEPNRDKLPKEHDDNEIIMSKIDLHERSEEEPAGYEEKVYGRRCGKLQEVSTNRGAVAAAKVNKSESFPSNDNQGNGSKETKLLQTSTINQVTSAGMSERENSKGVALAWQSPNEVDEDQILFPEDRLNRPKVTSSGRTSLVSMVQHSAALREHFRDSRSNTFGVRNPLYNPNLTFDHTIHEGSNEDSDDESGEQITKEDEAIPEYQYESFIRDFKDVLDNDPTWNTAEAAQTTEPLVVWSQDKRESKSISGIASYEITNPRSKTNILPPITERRNHVAMARTTFEKRLSANGNATRPPQNQLKHKVQLHDTGLQDNILCSNITNTKHPLEDSIGHFHAIDIRSAADSERIEGSNHSKIPYNNLASNEQTNSRLEEKLRGLSNVSGKECGNSVATSELGSLLTRDSEVSHKFVPRSMFHRTHPSTHVATLRPSPSTIHNTFDNKGCIFATENELDAELNRKSYDDVNFNGITSSRARNAVPGPSAPITDTEPSVASKIKLGVNTGYLAVKSNNLHSSNVHAASAITRRNATSSDTHPSGFLKETNRFWTSRTKTPIKCRSSPEQHAALASAGQVKKAAAEYERKNMDNFGNQMEKNAKSSETKKNGVDKNKYSYKKRMSVNISAAEDGSQVSLSEAFDIAPRVQRNAKNGCIQNFRVCNVVNGGFKDNIENSGAFADSSLEDSTFRAIRDVFESSSQNAFEIAPKEKQELTRVQLQICSSHNISSKRTEDKSCTQIDKKQEERVKSSPFMKHVWTRQMKKLNIGVSENSKKPPMRPMSVLARGGNGIRKKHAEV